MPNNYSVYGNIPYYITSPILMHFLYEIDHLPDSLTITIQKEVADRILARDGKHSVLSLACQLVANITKICDINPNNFVPVPKVWSTCLCFAINPEDNERNKKILTIIKQGFLQKRKKLISNLTNAGHKNSTVQKAFLTV
ncbi:MAG: rRNA adenine N-6-methyltransferase family protein [bacterium]